MCVLLDSRIAVGDAGAMQGHQTRFNAPHYPSKDDTMT
jgi:hypothetical protein